MLAITLPHLGLLSLYSDPEWRPLLLAYLGYLLMTGCFVAVGLFISSLTRNQIVAGVATFGVFLMLWVVDWMGSFAGARAKSIYEYLSITGHFDDFTKGVLDTKHVVYYLSFITFGLFLTVRSVDSERWRG
jgi:ABC-2 type transport system permease protein